MRTAGLFLLFLSLAAQDDRSSIGEAKKFVEQVRGLKFARELEIRHSKPGDYGKKLLSEFRETFGQDLKSVEKFLKALRVVPDTLDLERAAQLFLLASFSAFYENGALTVDENVDALVLAHELEHALADQHFNFAQLRRQTPPDFDRLIALSSVFEGDAEVVRELQQYGATAKPDLAKLREYAEQQWKDSVKARPELPPVFTLGLRFSYTWGLYFVEWMRQKNGTDGIDRLFLKPPTSTEQVMHPERYGVDEPTVVDASSLEQALFKRGYRMTYRTTLGELGTRAVLWSILKEDQPQAADGWGGDRVELFEKGDARMLTWLSVWKSDGEAKKAKAAFVSAVKAISGQDPIKDKSAEEYLYFEKDGRAFWVERKGASLAVVLHASVADAPAAREAVWKCKKNSGKAEDF